MKKILIENLSNVLDHIPLAIFTLDVDGIIAVFNNNLKDLIETNPKIEKEIEDQIKNITEKIAGNKFADTIMFEVLFGDRYYLFDISKVIDNNSILGYMGIIEDVTSVKHTERKMALFSELIRQAPISIIVTDVKGNIEYVNKYLLDISGYTVKDLMGQNPRIFKSGLTSDFIYQDLWATITNGEIWSGRLVNKKKNGDLFVESDIIMPLKDSEGHITKFIGFKENITDKVKLEERILYDEAHDFLTGLYNRHQFEVEIIRCINDNKKNNSVYFVCIINIDDFKVINDVIGYDAGDDLLKSFASFLKSSFPEYLVACLGGDEFSVIIPNVRHDRRSLVRPEMIDDVYNKCEEFRKKVMPWRFIWNESSFKITISIGISYIDRRCNNVSSILSQADSACNEAKATGKNKIVVYRDTAEFKRRKQRQEMFLKLRTNLEQNKLFLLFQKIVPANPDDKIHYEALIRMRDNNHLVSPVSFLEVAESFQIVYDVDMWVIETVFRYLNIFQKFMTIDFIITINLSSKTISDMRCLEDITRLLKHYDINPKTIGFEMTETSAISNFEIAHELTEKLRKLGCLILLDDFGSGMSSFSRFQSFLVDIVKIDGGFIRDLDTSEFDQGIVKGIVGISKTIKAKTVAEYVHNEAVYLKAKELEVDYFQGFYFHTPQPICSLFCGYIDCAEKSTVKSDNILEVIENCKLYQDFKGLIDENNYDTGSEDTSII